MVYTMARNCVTTSEITIALCSITNSTETFFEATKEEQKLTFCKPILDKKESKIESSSNG